jgi:soluble P-type ATPase
VPLRVEIPGRGELHLEYLLLDVNGTLTNRGALLAGVEERIGRLRETIDIHLVSADTFGTLDSTARRLRVVAVTARSGEDKLRRLEQLGPERSAVIGNGANDELVLHAAALSIAVIGPEGASAVALRAADVVCLSAVDALDLLLETQALSATLRP